MFGICWNWAHSTLSLGYQDRVCVSFMLIVTPCPSCGHPYPGVLDFHLLCQRTATLLVCCRPVIYSNYLHNLQDRNKLWLQLPWNKPGGILVEQLLLFVSCLSWKGPLQLRAAIKLKAEGRKLLSSWIPEDTTKPLRGRSASGKENSCAKTQFLITKLGGGSKFKGLRWASG